MRVNEWCQKVPSSEAVADRIPSGLRAIMGTPIAETDRRDSEVDPVFARRVG